jgi:phosphate/phosphite/phosphonate ABC transporter binding protein
VDIEKKGYTENGEEEEEGTSDRLNRTGSSQVIPRFRVSPSTVGSSRGPLRLVIVLSAAVGLAVGVGMTLLSQLVWKGRKGAGDAPAAENRASGPAGGVPGVRTDLLQLGMAYYVPNKVVRKEMTDLAVYLQKRLGIRVVFRDIPYGEVAQRLEQGRLDLAMFTPYLYVKARQKHKKFVLLGTQLADGSLTYEGYVVVPETSPVRNLKALKGKRFCFVSRKSTSGYLFPSALLKRNGLNPERDFSRVLFSGSHHAAVQDVVKGRCDAAAVAAGAYLKAMVHHTANIRIVAVTERIPGNAYCASPHLPPRLIERVQHVLITFDPRRDLNRKFIGPAHRVTGFVAVSDRHYDPVRRVHGILQKPVR